MPDGPDRPWTRGRRTRWWLVVPADVVAVVLVAVLVAASGHDMSVAGGLARDGLGSLVWGWLAAWGFTRRNGDHLESPAPEGVVVLVVTSALWLARRAYVLGAAVALHERGIPCVLVTLGNGAGVDHAPRHPAPSRRAGAQRRDRDI